MNLQITGPKQVDGGWQLTISGDWQAVMVLPSRDLARKRKQVILAMNEQIACFGKGKHSKRQNPRSEHARAQHKERLTGKLAKMVHAAA